MRTINRFWPLIISVMLLCSCVLGTQVKKTFPDKRDVHIASDDGIQYQYLIQTMDTALTAQFPDIALTDINAAHL